MKNDILPPPQRPQKPTAPTTESLVRQDELLSPAVEAMPSSLPPEEVSTPSTNTTPLDDRLSSKHRHLKRALYGIAVLVVMLIVAVGWYLFQLRPASSDQQAPHVRVIIQQGMGASAIGNLLAQQGLIRNVTAFDLYTRLQADRNKFQAGIYSLSPSLSTQIIVDRLVSGKTDQISVTFLPGATLAQDRQALIKSGYSQTEVDIALQKSYTSPLFIDKPAGSSLEGYIYGDTYSFESSATVEQILQRTFDHFNDQVNSYNLVNAFKAQGLSLYQGITLASIIQREVATPSDMRQVAQVFLKRLSDGMPLGSDVTYQYIADKTGVPRNPNLDSPYNTRRYPGLPPGPIAMPGLTALQAVAHPAAGDYVYFLSGDDNVTYFARTNAEHEANIKAHCQVKCSIN